MTLADDVALLVGWFRHDILTVAGPCYTDRCQLYDFVVAELRGPRVEMPPSAGADLPRPAESTG